MFRQSKLVSIRGHHFYAIKADTLVVDLGAHLGEFSSEISNRFGCRCYAVEALPSLFPQIKEDDLVKKFNYAITDVNAPTKLYVSKNPEANSIHRLAAGIIKDVIVVDGVTFETFLGRNGISSIDLLKVDIEGAEIQLFDSTADKTLREIKQITIEFHDFVESLYRASQVQRIKKRLISLGFICTGFSLSYNTDVLFLNKKKCKISNSEYLYLKYFVKYVEGFLRVLKRRKKHY